VFEHDKVQNSKVVSSEMNNCQSTEESLAKFQYFSPAGKLKYGHVYSVPLVQVKDSRSKWGGILGVESTHAPAPPSDFQANQWGC
jgi:hypothetical protein